MKFKASGDKEYKVWIIIDSALYSQQANNNQIPGLYYLILWKNNPEKESPWESSLAIIHLQKLINTLYKEHPKKPIATSLPLDSVPPMAKPTVLKKPKQKRDRPNKKINKRGRNKSVVQKLLREWCLSWPQIWILCLNLWSKKSRLYP